MPTSTIDAETKKFINEKATHWRTEMRSIVVDWLDGKVSVTGLLMKEHTDQPWKKTRVNGKDNMFVVAGFIVATRVRGRYFMSSTSGNTRLSNEFCLKLWDYLAYDCLVRELFRRGKTVIFVCESGRLPRSIAEVYSMWARFVSIRFIYFAESLRTSFELSVQPVSESMTDKELVQAIDICRAMSTLGTFEEEKG